MTEKYSIQGQMWGICMQVNRIHWICNGFAPGFIIQAHDKVMKEART